MQWKTLAAAALLSCGMMSLGGASAQAAEVKIGLSAEPSSLDPHYHNLGPNNQIAYTIFDTLVLQDATQKLQPGLATRRKPTSEKIGRASCREIVCHYG